MKSNLLAKIEEIYLQLFKIVLLIVLTVALMVSGFLLVKGLAEMAATPNPPSPAKENPAPARKAEKPTVDVDGFLKELERQETPPPEKAAPAPQTSPPKAEKIEQKEDPLDAMTDSYIAKLWTYFAGYQSSCGVPNPTDKQTFFQAFPRTNLKQWFQKFGPEFAESQDRFEQKLLQNERVIALCKSKSGKAQIFVASLTWHYQQWDAQVKAGERFEREERQRVESAITEEQRRVEREQYLEEARVAAKHADSIKSLVAALIAFGVFTSIALLLIFSKIESNLRVVRLVAPDGT